MAPTTSKRSSIHSRGSKTKSIASNPLRHTHSIARSAFPTTKKDKRAIKHSAHISRIEKSKPQTKRHRRPAKKLIASLNSLTEALPAAEEAEPVKTATTTIRHRSLKSKPGAMKKKEKIISMEKDRFNKNMAQMAAWQPSAADRQDASHLTPANNHSHADTKWAALRSFIRQTMEKRPDPK
ncbi:MAG: hypothetical protein L6R41_002979 [Letrouitia leprolyta]|nr:MAG: hypothetical protein L6R41_002979 [Letrouitia leprolyta]